MFEVEKERFSKELSNAYAIALKEKRPDLSYAIIVGLYKNPLKFDNEDPKYIKEFSNIVAIDNNNQIINIDGVFKLEDLNIDDFDFKNPINELILFHVKRRKDLSKYVEEVKEDEILLAKTYIEKNNVKNKFKIKRTK